MAIERSLDANLGRNLPTMNSNRARSTSSPRLTHAALLGAPGPRTRSLLVRPARTRRTPQAGGSADRALGGKVSNVDARHVGSIGAWDGARLQV
jgi:hypothetical protein